MMALAESSSARFTDVDRGVVDGAGLLHLVGHQPVLLVEKQDAELLAGLEAQAARQYSMTAFQLDSTGWCMMPPFMRRNAPALTSRSCSTAESPTPLTSFSRSAGALMTSAKEPNLCSRSLAIGLVSRRGTALNSSNSSSS